MCLIMDSNVSMDALLNSFPFFFKYKSTPGQCQWWFNIFILVISLLGYHWSRCGRLVVVHFISCKHSTIGCCWCSICFCYYYSVCGCDCAVSLSHGFFLYPSCIYFHCWDSSISYMGASSSRFLLFVVNYVVAYRIELACF